MSRSRTGPRSRATARGPVSSATPTSLSTSLSAWLSAWLSTSVLASALAAILMGVVGATGAAAAPSATPTAGGDAPAASAEECPATGARVVVDFGDLAEDPDARVRVACADDVAGERAEQTLDDAGIDLTYATRSAGFVCRVEGVPADDPCVNAARADAYWSVWWASAEGDWVYSAQGVGMLRTPEGGDLALVWHRGAGKAQAPSTAPGSALSDAAPAAQDAGTDGDSLPVWVPVAVVVAVVVLGGGVAVARRRNG